MATNIAAVLFIELTPEVMTLRSLLLSCGGCGRCGLGFHGVRDPLGSVYLAVIFVVRSIFGDIPFAFVKVVEHQSRAIGFEFLSAWFEGIFVAGNVRYSHFVDGTVKELMRLSLLVRIGSDHEIEGG